MTEEPPELLNFMAKFRTILVEFIALVHSYHNTIMFLHREAKYQCLN
jgi:hypothetical protein